jgi:hypothetical protein
MHDGDLCFWHAPDHAEEAAAARKLGGQRRRRESTLAGAYELGPLDTIAGIRRILEIAVLDALGMENGVARVRLLIAAAQALGRLLETRDLEELVEQIRRVLDPRLLKEKRR